MDFGIHIGTRGCLTSRENVMAVAQRAEALGYAYLGVADHLIVPVQTGVRYPYTADGIWPGAPTGECFDCIATLAFLAGCTQRLKLLTSVAVVPHRPAVLAAKLFPTADVLSGGRVIAGVGTGWMREEFEALGTPPYEERGAVTDEYLTAWLALWNEPRPALRWQVREVRQRAYSSRSRLARPHLPIWVGGESPPALRRTVKFGDAWYPGSDNQTIRLNTPERLRDGVAGLHRVAEKAGRDPASIDVGYLWFAPPVWDAQQGPDGRQLFTGSSSDMLADAAALETAGARHHDPLSATADDRGDAGRDPALRRRGGTQGMMHDIETAPLDELMARAAAKRDAAHGRLVSYSRKVFIPLTKLCRDVCHYCTFAERPRAGQAGVSVGRRGAGDRPCRRRGGLHRGAVHPGRQAGTALPRRARGAGRTGASERPSPICARCARWC